MAFRLREDFISRRRGSGGLWPQGVRAQSTQQMLPSSLLDAKLMVQGLWEYQVGGSWTWSAKRWSEAQVVAP